MESSVRPTPEGFHTITPSLIVEDAARALEFYKRAFGAEVLFRMPMPQGSRLTHCSLKVGNSVFVVTDELPGSRRRSAASLSETAVSLNLSVEDADAAFDRAVQAGATALMPVTQMFWGDRFGMIADPFGHVWSFVSMTDAVRDVTGAKAASGSRET